MRQNFQVLILVSLFCSVSACWGNTIVAPATEVSEDCSRLNFGMLMPLPEKELMPTRVTGWNTLDEYSILSVMAVPVLGQRWDPWKNDQLGTCSGITIGSHGCAITSIAMIFNYYNVSTDPRHLNNYLTSNGGYANGCDVYWAKPCDISGGTISYAGSNSWASSADLNVVNSEIDSGYPPVARVILSGYTHYVVITGRSGSTYYINDPWYGDQSTINARYGTPTTAIKGLQKYRGSSCTPANIWWTSLPPNDRWFRSNERLAYSWSGTNPNVGEGPRAGNLGEIYMAEAGSGHHRYWARAWNACGDKTIDWYGYFDNTVPTASRTGGAAPNTWYKTPQSVTWSVSDAHSGVKSQHYRWNGGTWVGASGSTALPEGKNTLEIRVEDNAWDGGSQSGNVAVVNLGQYWLDTVAPSINLTGPTPSTWFNTPQSISWNVTDATSSVATTSLQWGSGTQETVPAIGSAQIPEGRYTATVRAGDVAGNQSSRTEGSYWIDTTRPLVAVGCDPAEPDGDNGWYVTTPSLTVAAEDPNGPDGSGVDGLFYTLNDDIELPFTVPVLIDTDGVHTFTARAADVAGNSGSTVHVVKLDRTAPLFSSLHVESESSRLDALAAAWECSDEESDIAEYEYRIGTTPGGDDVRTATSAGNNPWAYAVSLNVEPDETYYITIRARNKAGLWSDWITSAGILIVPRDNDQAPSLNMGGLSDKDNARISSNFKLVDSIGQFVVSFSESDNFTVQHGYWHSELVLPVFDSVGLAKAMQDGISLQLGAATNAVVVTVGTGVFVDRFYVEHPDRSSGIAVRYGPMGGPMLQEGDQLWLTGRMNTVNGERIIEFADVHIVPRIQPTILPLLMAGKDIGGSGLSDSTPGVREGIGLNNLGLLVKTYGGPITYIDPQGKFFYLDVGTDLYDGSHYGIRVICDGFADETKLTPPDPWKFITVTGISTTAIVNNQAVRAIRPRSQSDISEINSGGN